MTCWRNEIYVSKLVVETESVLYSFLFKFPFPTVITADKIMDEYCSLDLDKPTARQNAPPSIRNMSKRIFGNY